MATVSLCMIVKNEQDVLARCLDSVKDLVDEIIIVDTGSTDNTLEIAKKYTQNVYNFNWIDDFSAARNYSFSKATCQYLMWLDADDIILQQDQLKFAQLKKDLPQDTNVVMLPYNTGFDEKGNVTLTYFRERLIKNHTEMAWQGAVHEVVPPIGKIMHGTCAITHNKLHPSCPDRNLRIFENQLKNGITLDPRQLFYYARELYYHKRYQESIDILEDFLHSNQGWLENNIEACCYISYCHSMLENNDKSLQALFRSFAYDLPRAEVCCEIGNHFLKNENLRQSAFWYTIATTCNRDDSRGGFSSPACYTYLPCIQLCVVYSRLGEIESANRFNELAASYKPDSTAVAHNREYFASLK